jgi:hypothetical protein
LLTGTAGTGRAQPRRAAGRAGTGTAGRRVDGFFFQNRTVLVSYPCPSRVHGYHGYGYGYSGKDTCVFLLFL